MASFRFTSFFFMLMFVLRYSDANSQIPRGKDDIAVAVVGNTNPSTVEKFILGGVLTPKEAKNGNTLGRKRMRRVLMKKKEKAKETSSAILVTVHPVEISCKGKQNLNADCKQSSRITSDRHVARKLKFNSFMALNADYHPPKSHAPKNN